MCLPIEQIQIQLSKTKNSLVVTQHPYYLSVKNNDREQFDKWMQTQPSHQRLKPSGTWAGIQQLKQSLAKGFDHTKSSVSMKDGKCRHGRHRLCLLAVLNPGAKLVFRRNKLVSLMQSIG